MEFYEHQNAKQAVKVTNGNSTSKSTSFSDANLDQAFSELDGNRLFTAFTLDDAIRRQQADKLANLRRTEALKKRQSNPDYIAKLKTRKFNRKMKKLEKELSNAK